MFTAAQIAEILSITEAEATAALAGIDQPAIEAEELAAWVAEPYGGGDLNGRPAALFLAKIPPGGTAFIVYRAGSDHVRTFQPHAPELPGIVPMTEAEAASYGESERVRIASEAASTRIVEAVAAALANAG